MVSPCISSQVVSYSVDAHCKHWVTEWMECHDSELLTTRHFSALLEWTFRDRESTRNLNIYGIVVQIRAAPHRESWRNKVQFRNLLDYVKWLKTDRKEWLLLHKTFGLNRKLKSSNTSFVNSDCSPESEHFSKVPSLGINTVSSAIVLVLKMGIYLYIIDIRE